MFTWWLVWSATPVGLRACKIHIINSGKELSLSFYIYIIDHLNKKDIKKVLNFKKIDNQAEQGKLKTY